MSDSDLDPLDVIWLFHGTARGQAKKRMMVCVSPDEGFFLPINTSNRHRPCFSLPKHPDHDWLNHDSHVECDILVFDEFVIGESIREHGVVGYLASRHVDDILDGLDRSKVIGPADRAHIRAILTRYRNDA